MDIVAMSDRGSRPGRGAQKTITNTTTPGATRRDIHVDTESLSKLTQISMQSATHEHEGRMTICRDELLQMTPSLITRLSRIKVISVRDPKVNVTLSRRSFLTRAAVITWRSPYQRHVKTSVSSHTATHPGWCPEIRQNRASPACFRGVKPSPSPPIGDVRTRPSKPRPS